jgi:dolichyl-phosphate-mannose-protein mannosyltransferase
MPRALTIRDVDLQGSLRVGPESGRGKGAAQCHPADTSRGAERPHHMEGRLMGGVGRGRGASDWLWFLAWGIASSILCVMAARQLSATFDEPFYVASGLEFWRTGSHGSLLKKGTMPLPVDLVTLPLYLWERYQGAPFDAATDLERLLPWARAGTLVFWWLLLAYGLAAGRHLAGPWGGRLAVALLACEPSLLAHASLATTDIAITACLLALAYYFRTGREDSWLRRVGLPGLWFGAAVLSKASGLVLGPLCLLGVELERLWRGGAFNLAAPSRGLRARFRQVLDPLRPLRHDLVRVLAGGLILAFIYCGSDWRQEPSFVAWAHGLPDGTTGRIMNWLAERLHIFSNAGEGLINQIAHNVRGHGVYILGQTAPRALWYYFPLLLTIKLSLPLLMAPIVLAMIRPRALANWACLAAAALLLASVTFRVQIGIRLVLPLVAFAAAGLAAGVVQACETYPPGLRKRLVAAGAAAGIIWTAWASAAVWPNALSYVNELWGGTSNGYLRVSESNYDWGQGLKELARWQQHRPVLVDVWYYGTDPALRRLPLRPVPLHALLIGGPEDVVAQVRGHFLAVSTTLLYGVPLTDSHKHAQAFLLTRRPVARTMTFLIYDFTQDRPIAASDLHDKN